VKRDSPPPDKAGDDDHACQTRKQEGARYDDGSVPPIAHVFLLAGKVRLQSIFS
jgi:hypothetical protein